MAEYIDREAAIDKHCAICKDNTLCYRSRESCPEVKVFNSIPAADVAPVRRGRWERYSQGHPVPKNGSRSTHIVVYCDWFRCSECGVGFEAKTFYCPNCGANMDLE